MEKLSIKELEFQLHEQLKDGPYALKSQNQAEAIRKAIVNILTENLVEDKTIAIPGFGTFSKVLRAERQGQNPQTGETMTIPASNSVRFKPSRTLKDLVNWSDLLDQ